LNENNPKLILLHCVSSYPCPSNIANLKKIAHLASVFKTITGYSDHTTGLDIAIAACSLGATVLEKHFTLDRKLDGPDHNFSLIPNELNQLVVSTKRVFEATQDLGFGIDNSEINTALNLRRSIFYDKNIKKGQKVQLSDLTIKSPGIGLHPRHLDQIIGSRINCDAFADTPVIFSHFLDKDK
jgi:N,N'-diacetyllegionaminate synthase